MPPRGGDRGARRHPAGEALPLAAFSPYPLGPSDRLANVEVRKARIDRVLAATERGVRPDRATQSVLQASAELVLAMLNEVGDQRVGEALLATTLRPALPVPNARQ